MQSTIGTGKESTIKIILLGLFATLHLLNDNDSTFFQEHSMTVICKKNLIINILIVLSFKSANAGLSFMTLLDSSNSALKLAHVLSYFKTMHF